MRIVDRDPDDRRGAAAGRRALGEGQVRAVSRIVRPARHVMGRDIRTAHRTEPAAGVVVHHVDLGTIQPGLDLVDLAGVNHGEPRTPRPTTRRTEQRHLVAELEEALNEVRDDPMNPRVSLWRHSDPARRVGGYP